MTDEIQITPSNQGVPTQVANPARASWRTAIQSAVAFLIAANAALPIAAQVISDNSALGERYLGAHYGAIVLGVNGAVVVGAALSKGVARIMAVPAVNAFIEKRLPWLAAIKVDK